MPDNLRDRIAAVLASVEVVLDGWDNLNETSTFLLADAVIAELGLQAQHLDRASCVGNKPAIRYVTEWTLDRADRSYCMRCGIPHQTGVCRREDHT